MTRLMLTALLGLAIATPAKACMGHLPPPPDAIAMKNVKKVKRAAPMKDEAPVPPTAMPPRG